MAPTTPRTEAGARHYTANATPRSVRRLTSAGTPSRVAAMAPPELPSLPPLNSKKYPSTPYADDPEFYDTLQQDQENLESTIDMLTRTTDDVKRQLREHLAHLETERISYENRIKELGEVAREMVRNQDKERQELDKAKQNEGEVNRQSQKLKVKLEGYQQEVKEALTRLEQRKALKARQLEAFNAQVAINKPELDFFEQKLGFKFKGKQNDVVQFKFVNLDRTSYSRSFSFDLDVSTPLYILSSVSPPDYLPVSTTDELVRTLNSNEIDLYTFVRHMRFAFCVEIELEKRLGPPPPTTTTTKTGRDGGGRGEEEVEIEREKERRKIEMEADGSKGR